MKPLHDLDIKLTQGIKDAFEFQLNELWNQQRTIINDQREIDKRMDKIEESLKNLIDICIQNSRLCKLLCEINQTMRKELE